eukprot:COSAG02_NODE_998_length_15331_cov_38.406119_12_plen_56_part_00
MLSFCPMRGSDACQNHLRVSFHCVCPEPVLAKEHFGKREPCCVYPITEPVQYPSE